MAHVFTLAERAVLAYAALFAVMSTFAIVVPSAAQSPTWLTGQLLIASPDMSDPRFEHTVILMVRHDRDGAFGIVINRPVGEQSLSKLLEAMGDQDTGAPGRAPIFYGGPVQPELGFVIHSTDYADATTRDIDGRAAMTSSRAILRAIGTDSGPKKSIFALGYTGWAPGQLEGEIARRGWVTAPADIALIFDVERDQVWKLAYARRVQDL